MILLFVCGGCLGETKTNTKSTSGRHIINLGGTWEIAQGSMDLTPNSFQHKVPVPGLVDMAEPAFDEIPAAPAPIFDDIPPAPVVDPDA